MQLKRTVKVLFIGMLMSCLFTACGESGGSADIVGTWVDTEVEDIKFIFNSDGTWQYVSNMSAHGTWKLTEGKNNEIQMPSESGLGEDRRHVGSVHEFSIDGDILTLDGVGEYERES